MNFLQNETSPYLLQHAKNPVDWYPWGNVALEKAKKENKLIVVSIGYSACHWCHVMEHESFEDEEVAEVMNALYVNIKVDREERPDIDQIYMSALQLMNGTGGWPLNCILLPDGRPIYGGTYFRKQDWINILTNIAAMHRNKPSELIDYANKLIEGVRNMEHISVKSNATIPNNFLVEHLKTWERFLDFENGGTIGAPKFPVPSNLIFLLRYGHLSNEDKMLSYVKTSLDNIANGGIYDQIGGGIYRYSVDGVWKIPHFEKMLYDQAQIISLYSEAFSKFKDPLYEKIVYNTIEFCKNELLNTNDHLFYSALDADSEGVEGKYYCFTIEEIKQVLTEDAELFIEYYQCTKEGNFEHGLNNLFALKDSESFINKHNLQPDSWHQSLSKNKEKLKQYRSNRIRPGLDDKQLSAWNSLMVKGLCDAYKYLGTVEYKNLAIQIVESLCSNMYKDSVLYRSFKNNEVKVPGFLDDYAFFIQALLHVYEISSNEKYFDLANEILSITNQEFYDSTSGMYWYTSNSSENLVARKQEYYDSVIPSSNAVMMHNLKQFYTYTSNVKFEHMADDMVNNIVPIMKKYPPSFSLWANYILTMKFAEIEIIITGKDSEKLYKEITKHYLPNVLFSYADVAKSNALHLNRYSNEKTQIYVCKNKSCNLPVITVEEAIALI